MTQVACSRKTPTGVGLAFGWANRLAGATLLASAALKSRQYATMPAVPHGLWEAQVLEPGLIAFEIFLGLWLVSGSFPNIARRVAIGCFGTFACYTLYEGLIGKADCGCFGQVHVNPWFTFALDVAMVLALVFLAKPKGLSSPGQSNTRRQNWPVAVSLVIGLAAGGITAMLHPKPVAAANGLVTADGGKLVILEPHHWIGSGAPEPVLKHILTQGCGAGMGQRLAHGNWIVMFYHASCDECRHTIPIYENLARQNAASGDGTRVAFVRVPSGFGGVSAATGPGIADPRLFHTSPALHGIMDQTHQWFATTPAVVQLENGIVLRAAAGSSAMNLKWLKAGDAVAPKAVKR